MSRRNGEKKESQVGAIVLMAGSSHRMPSENKLLLKIGGQSIAAKTVGNLSKAGFFPIVIVTGHEADRIEEVLQDYSVIFIHNEEFQEGMGSSIRKGMNGTEGWDGALIAMGDMPFVSIQTLVQIRVAFEQNPNSIIAPIFGERRGQPVLFSAQFFEALRQCSGDIGGRNIIKKNRDNLQLITVDQEAIFWDIDTPEDAEKYQQDIGNE